MVENLNEDKFKRKVVVERQTCVIKFYSDGCHLCVHLKPVYEEMANEFKKSNNKIKFYKVDVDAEEKLTERLNFEGVPTLFLFHNGRYSEIPYPYDDPDDLTGYRKDDIIAYIRKRVGV